MPSQFPPPAAASLTPPEWQWRALLAALWLADAGLADAGLAAAMAYLAVLS